MVSCLTVRLGRHESNSCESYPEEPQTASSPDVVLPWLTAETRGECRVIIAVHVDMSIDMDGFLVSDSRD